MPHWQRDAQPNTMTYTCIPSTWGGEAEGSEFKVILMLLNDSYLKGQPGIHELLSQERKKRVFSNLTAWVWKLVDKIVFSDCIPSVGKSIVKLFRIKWHCEFTLVAFGLAHVEERWRQHLHATVSINILRCHLIQLNDRQMCWHHCIPKCTTKYFPGSVERAASAVIFL